MVDRPLCFLDVDGVLNVAPGTPDAKFVGRLEGIYAIHEPAGLKERVDRLREAFDMVWMTTWREKAHPFWAPRLDLPVKPWPWVDFNVYKIPSLVAYANGRRSAFVDDEAKRELVERPHFKDLNLPGLIVSPLWEGGLTDDHVEQLLAYAKGDS